MSWFCEVYRLDSQEICTRIQTPPQLCVWSWVDYDLYNQSHSTLLRQCFVLGPLLLRYAQAFKVKRFLEFWHVLNVGKPMLPYQTLLKAKVCQRFWSSFYLTGSWGLKKKKKKNTLLTESVCEWVSTWSGSFSYWNLKQRPCLPMWIFSPAGTLVL